MAIKINCCHKIRAIGYFQVASCLSINTSLFVKTYENEFHLQVHFHKEGFARRLILKQRHKVTCKWPIKFMLCNSCFTVLPLKRASPLKIMHANSFCESSLRMKVMLEYQVMLCITSAQIKKYFNSLPKLMSLGKVPKGLGR